ncbi:spore coat associated protein CotJA [Clostridium tetani]|uniref:spore coat associated protein CotJA n=1 Tax=Clostridium tetani TaxID=1513 RepID=UPI001FB1442E|nr:spore coat associated protein CotJA [Clostridium tetani]
MYQNCNPYINPYHSHYGNCCTFKNCKLTRAYIPHQPYGKLFPLNEALKKGTLFANLYIPYPEKSYCK